MELPSIEIREIQFLLRNNECTGCCGFFGLFGRVLKFVLPDVSPVSVAAIFRGTGVGTLSMLCTPVPPKMPATETGETAGRTTFRTWPKSTKNPQQPSDHGCESLWEYKCLFVQSSYVSGWPFELKASMVIVWYGWTWTRCWLTYMWCQKFQKQHFPHCPSEDAYYGTSSLIPVGCPSCLCEL